MKVIYPKANSKPSSVAATMWEDALGAEDRKIIRPLLFYTSHMPGNRKQNRFDKNLENNNEMTLLKTEKKGSLTVIETVQKGQFPNKS